MSRGLPDGWRWARLAEIAEIVMGQSPPSTTYRDSPEGLPFFQGKADFGPRHPTARKWCIEPKKIARVGDILISVRAPVGPTNVADVECCIGRGLAAIRAHRDLDQEFLLHALKVVEPEIVAQGTGSTFQAISGEQLRSVKIPLPSLDEQHRIADAMTLAERARSVAVAQLAAIDELAVAVLREIFPPSPTAPLRRGWRWVKLGDVCEIVNGSTPASKVPEYWGGEITWVTPADLGSLETPLIEGSLRTITQAGYDSCSTTLVPAGSVILSTRAPIGHLGIATRALCTNQGCKSLLPSDKVVTEFLYCALLHYMDDLRALGTGATFAEVSKRTLASFSIAIAPLDEQHRLADQMRSLRNARSAAVAQLAAIVALYDALLKQMFRPPTG